MSVLLVMVFSVLKMVFVRLVSSDSYYFYDQIKKGKKHSLTLKCMDDKILISETRASVKLNKEVLALMPYKYTTEG